MVSMQEKSSAAEDISPAPRTEEGIVEEKYHHRLDADQAQAFTEQHAGVTLTPEQDKRILRKIDLYLMPLMLTVYTLNFMDKNALSYSANWGLETDNHLHGQQYSWASGSVFYLAYMVSQPVVSRMMQWFPIGRFVSINVILWGAVLMTTAACRSFASLMTVRAILGCVESCINPAFLVITSQWYTRKEQPERVGYWFFGNALGQILGGIIGYGIGHIRPTGVPRWGYFFIIFGAFTICFGIFCLFFIPDSPMTARWLSEEDRALVVERVRENRTGIRNDHFKLYQFWEALKDLKLWILFVMTVLNTISSGGVASYGNIVIKDFGFSSLNTTLLQMPLGAVQGITIILTGFYTRFYPNSRALIMSVTQIPALIGAVLLYTLPHHNRTGRLISYYIIQTHSISMIMCMASLSANIAGYTKRATCTGIIFMAFCAGQVIGPQLFISTEAPDYPTAFRAAFVCFSLLTVMPPMYQGYLMWENKRRDKLAAAQGDELVQVHDEFFDLTDMEQRLKFRYVY